MVTIILWRLHSEGKVLSQKVSSENICHGAMENSIDVKVLI